MSGEVIPYAEKIGALSIVDVRAQVQLIQQVMKEVMHKDEHYGVIPGTGTKPTLLKAGAEKLCLTFRLDPQYEIEQKQEGNHLTIMSKCTLYHIPSGQRFGSGMGSCSTKESKYAWRQSGRKCPSCGAEAIIKGKDFKGDGKPTGWICFAKKNGCGMKFLDGDAEIEKQSIGRTPNEDIADQYNTVLKMANKRSLVAAVLNTTAASDIFTQDIEDTPQPISQPEKDVTPVVQAPPLQDVLDAISRMKTKSEKEAAKALAERLTDPDQVKTAETAWKFRMNELWKPNPNDDKTTNPVGDIKSDLL